MVLKHHLKMVYWSYKYQKENPKNQRKERFQLVNLIKQTNNKWGWVKSPSFLFKVYLYIQFKKTNYETRIQNKSSRTFRSNC